MKIMTLTTLLRALRVGAVACCVLTTSASAVAQDDAEALARRIVELEAKIAELESKCSAAASKKATSQSSEQTVVDLTRRVQSMRPDSAAQLLATLDQDLARLIFMRLDRRGAARILDRMPTVQAAAMVHSVAAEADLVSASTSTSAPAPASAQDATTDATTDAAGEGGEDVRAGGS
ncbi:MAG: hypothetical protein AAGI01_04070 [Myxococcota bacterium]